MTKQREKFDEPFKLELAKMVIDQGLSVPHVSATSMTVGQALARRL